MFYACSLDPENCGVKFASKLVEIFLSSNKHPSTRQVSLWLKFSHSLHDMFCHFSNHKLGCASLSPPLNRMSAVAYLASFLARGKFLPVSFVASMLKRWKRFLQNVTSNIII